MLAAEQRSNDVAVRDEHHRTVVLPSHLIDEARGAFLSFGHAFAARTTRRAPSFVPTHPARIAVEFDEGAPGPVAEVDLVQRIGRLNRKIPVRRDHLRGRTGPSSRARIDGFDVFAAKPARKQASLLPSLPGQPGFRTATR